MQKLTPDLNEKGLTSTTTGNIFDYISHHLYLSGRLINTFCIMVGGNTPLSQPPFLIAVRPEHIAAAETNLIIKPKCGDLSPEDQIVKDSDDGSTVFAMAGKKHGERTGRQFCDGSRLPYSSYTG